VFKKHPDYETVRQEAKRRGTSISQVRKQRSETVSYKTSHLIYQIKNLMKGGNTHA
jgi:hypothetical protein